MDRYDILNRMLDTLPDNYDTSEGNPLTDLLMSVAIELENSYLDQEDILNKGFADTSYDEWLDKIVNEVGITRKEPTKASGVVKISGSVGTRIEAGTLVSTDTINFEVVEESLISDLGMAIVKVECIEYGSIGNVAKGMINMLPIPIAGIESVTNENAFENGYDEESDEELRDRYYTKVRTPATSGNKYHYLNWAKEVPGVGDAKVFPLWDGNGTVKLVIIDSNKRAASSQLIKNVENYIEDNRPIGATVTIESATEVKINIEATLVIDTSNYELSIIKNSFESILNKYLGEIAFKQTYVSYAKIGSLLMSVDGVIDYSNLTINGNHDNILIQETEIVAIGQVNFNE